MRARHLLIPLLLLGGGCPPSTRYSDADVPKLPSLKDVMWAQAQACDPAFKKIGQSAFADADWALATACAQRIQLTTARAKSDFSKGAEFNGFADTLASHGREVADAATARDVGKTSAGLQGMKDTCKACHSKYR